MLSAVGIVSEYNPFHNGHLYQLQRAKQITGADIVVAVMSGNWLQRGEPAIYDKWERTRAAINNGVDIVIELPFFSAVQPSHIFSTGAVRLITAMNCRWLAFGAENPNIDYLKLIKNQPERDASFRQFDRPYASIFQDYLKKKTGIQLNQPNDILAFGYSNANFNLGSPLNLVPIQRIGSDHNQDKLSPSGLIASASAIRNAIHSDLVSEVNKFVPRSTFSMIQGQRPITWNDFWPLLRFELVEAPISQLHQIYQMTEGIEYRLKRCAIKADTFKTFLHLVKTKRYTYTRIQRLCTYVLLHATEAQMLNQPNYLRLLGFSKNGQVYLNQIKNKLKLPLITKINEEVVKNWLQMDFGAGMLFQMINNKSQDYYRHPLIIGN